MFPSVEGLGNTLTHAYNGYATALQTFWTTGLVQTLAKTLRITEGMRTEDATAEALTRLTGSRHLKKLLEKHNRKGAKKTASSTAGTIRVETPTDAVKLVHDCLVRLEGVVEARQEEDRECDQNGRRPPTRKPFKLHSLVPLPSMTRRFVHYDATQLAKMQREREELRPAEGSRPLGLDGVFQAKPPRKGHVLGSVLTDGIQAIFRWDKPTTETWRLAPEKRDEIVAARVEKAALRQQYEAQESRATGLQAELAALKAEKGPKEAIRQKKAEIKENRKIDGRTVRTKTRFADMRICPKTEGLEHAKTGYFAQDALGTVERTELPTNLIAVDAGHANVWSASRYNPAKKDWERVAELTSGQYRHGIGLRRFQRWMETSLRRPKMQMAREKLSRSTLKVSDAETYVVNLKTRAEAWTTLHGFYGGKRYARRRFAQQKTKQRFEATFLDSFMEKCEQKKGDTVIAYGDGLFATSLPGCDGGTPHARLCRKLAGRCVVVERRNMISLPRDAPTVGSTHTSPTRHRTLANSTAAPKWCSRKELCGRRTATAWRGGSGCTGSATVPCATSSGAGTTPRRSISAKPF